jgi:hypothetical protein
MWYAQAMSSPGLFSNKGDGWKASAFLSAESNHHRVLALTLALSPTLTHPIPSSISITHPHSTSPISILIAQPSSVTAALYKP